jgi:hypothetical protein
MMGSWQLLTTRSIDGYDDPNFDRKFDLVAAGAGPFVKALADLQNRQKRFEENLMNRFEQFCDETMDFFELKLKSIKDKMKRYEEMNALVLSGGAAMQKLDDEEAEEHAAAALAAAYKEEEDDNNDINPKDAQAQFLIDGWKEKEDDEEDGEEDVK